MSHAIWTPLAEAELEDIVYYIAVEDRRPTIAEQIANEIRDRADFVAATPAVWQRHPDLPLDWFYSLHKWWLIAFQEHSSGIDVLRVIDTSRDFTRLFGAADE